MSTETSYTTAQEIPLGISRVGDVTYPEMLPERLGQSYTLEYLSPDDSEWAAALTVIDGIMRRPVVRECRARMKAEGDEAMLQHSDRVAFAAIVLGLRMHLPFETLPVIGEAAECHDIGRLDPAIQVVTQLPTRYEGVERERVMPIIRNHVYLGAAIVLGLADRAGDENGPSVAAIIAGHHAFSLLDSYGTYPTLLTRETEITAFSDEFDALATGRSYKVAMTRDETRRTLERQFAGDPMLISLCFDHRLTSVG